MVKSDRIVQILTFTVALSVSVTTAVVLVGSTSDDQKESIASLHGLPLAVAGAVGTGTVAYCVGTWIWYGPSALALRRLGAALMIIGLLASLSIIILLLVVVVPLAVTTVFVEQPPHRSEH